MQNSDAQHVETWNITNDLVASQIYTWVVSWTEWIARTAQFTKSKIERVACSDQFESIVTKVCPNWCIRYEQIQAQAYLLIYHEVDCHEFDHNVVWKGYAGRGVQGRVQKRHDRDVIRLSWPSDWVLMISDLSGPSQFTRFLTCRGSQLLCHVLSIFQHVSSRGLIQKPNQTSSGSVEKVSLVRSISGDEGIYSISWRLR